jgi:hypothetical protein
LLAPWLWLQRERSAIGRRRAVAVSLAELEARTLKDIGLEAWRSPLGAEVALRRHDARRWRAGYLGLW